MTTPSSFRVRARIRDGVNGLVLGTRVYQLVAPRTDVKVLAASFVVDIRRLPALISELERIHEENGDLLLAHGIYPRAGGNDA